MRFSIALVLCLAGAGCQRAPAPPTFDGGQASDRAAVLRHGERLTYVLGCRGCHGKDLQGTFFTKDEPQYGPLYASNLTVQIPEYSDAQLDGVIRRGTHPERKTVWGMPSQIFQNLSDPDFKALVAYLRTLKPQGQRLPNPQFSAQDRKDIAAGRYKPADQMVADYKRAQPVDLGRQYAFGRYITTVSCEECHGSDLHGDASGPVKTPDLIVAGGYTREQFEALTTKGVPVGGRKLNPMMLYTALGRLSHLTPHERDALYAYLKERAAQPEPASPRS
jgi:mono/diheme cytochrome c family protein